MLKLHHMNLLNEIQETTLMMNLYQQQQLQQQQQQLQQQASAELGVVGGGGVTDSQLTMLMHQQSGGLDPLFGASQLQQRGSLGLGGGPLSNFGGPQTTPSMNSQQAAAASATSGSNALSMGGAANEEMQNRTNALTAEMARSDSSKMPAAGATSGDASGTNLDSKRSGDGDDAGSSPTKKRQKTEKASAGNDTAAGDAAGTSDSGNNGGGGVGVKEEKE
jgi:hypothetical protein